MGILISCAFGATCLAIKILIQEFNEGTHGNFTSWISGLYCMSGLYWALDSAQSSEYRWLVVALCLLPSITILIVKLVRRVSNAERV